MIPLAAEIEDDLRVKADRPGNESGPSKNLVQDLQWSRVPRSHLSPSRLLNTGSTLSGEVKRSKKLQENGLSKICKIGEKNRAGRRIGHNRRLRLNRVVSLVQITLVKISPFIVIFYFISYFRRKIRRGKKKK